MRTTIILDRNEQGEWDETLGYLELSHEAPLTDEQLEAFRELGRVVGAQLATPKPHPPRDRGEGTGVDGLMPVGQEDTPSE